MARKPTAAVLRLSVVAQTSPRPAGDGTKVANHSDADTDAAEALNAPSLFISYAHEDGKLAHALAAALRSRGCRVWIDVDDMRIGDDMVSRIGDAIDLVDFLLAIISGASVQSPWCKRELSIAVAEALRTNRVKVLPIRIGSVALPPSLEGIHSPRIDPSNVDALADRNHGRHGTP